MVTRVRETAVGGRSSTADLVVVIVTYNSSDVITSALDALQEALRPVPGVAVVIADNHSHDDTVAVARAHSVTDVVISGQYNAGYAAGINRGLEAVTPTRAMLALNADAVLKADAVVEMLAMLDRPDMPATGIVAPRLVDEHGGLRFSLRREPSLPRALGEAVLGGSRAARWPQISEIVTDPAQYRDGAVSDWATGAALLVSQDCASTIGTWDEDYFLYSEETEYALRARDAGFKLRYADGAVVSHAGGDMDTSPFLWSIQAVNRVRLYSSRHDRFATFWYRGAVILNELLRVGGATHRAALKALVSGRRPELTD